MREEDVNGGRVEAGRRPGRTMTRADDVRWTTSTADAIIPLFGLAVRRSSAGHDADKAKWWTEADEARDVTWLTRPMTGGLTSDEVS